MDTIIIRDLAVDYRVGVTDDERAKSQRLLLTVEISHPFDRAAAGDDLNETVDYYAVSRRLLKLGEGRQWKLIETLAVEIAEVLLREFGALAVLVEVKKFILPEARYVAVRVVRPQSNTR